MPDNLFPWRDTLRWQFCYVCGTAAAAYIGDAPASSPIICFSCTGFHPHFNVPDRAEHLEVKGRLFERMGNLPLARHYEELARRERARPPIYPTREPEQLEIFEGIDVQI